MKKNNFNKYLNLIQKNCSDGIGNLHLLNSFFYQNLIIDAAKIIIQCFKKNKKILVCGNGGSAADSQHFAAELVGKFLIKKRDLMVVFPNLYVKPGGSNLKSSETSFKWS